jgi:hypothetical protein
MTTDSLSQMLSDFLDGAHAAVVVEDGAIAFDLAESKYSVSGEYNKCRLHLWSSERNFVRRALDAEVKGTTLRLQVQRMGQNRPTRLDFCRDRDQRSRILRLTRSCVICRPRSIGNCWELTSGREEIRVVFRKKPVRMPHLAIPA